MSRHGLPSAIALLILVAGCQKPWRSTNDFAGLPSGLDEPNSLIEFPESIAKYPDDLDASEFSRTDSGVRQADVQPADSASAVVLTSDDLPASQSSRRMLETMLEEAGDSLREASAASAGASKDMHLGRASSKYAKVLQQDPDNGVAHHRLGVIGDMKHDFLNAEHHYRLALGQTPHNPDLLSDIGYSYQLQDRPDVAEKFLQRALDINPTHSRAANNLGKLAAEQGDYEKAYSLFERAGSREHADRAIAYFFPEGRPANKNQTQLEAFADMTTANQNSRIQAVAESSAGPGTDDDAMSVRDRVELARAELARQFEEPDLLPATNGNEDAVIALSTPSPATRTPSVQPDLSIANATSVSANTGSQRAAWKSIVEAPRYTFGANARPQATSPMGPAYQPQPPTVDEDGLFNTVPIDPASTQPQRDWTRPTRTVSVTQPAGSVTPAQYPFAGVVSEPGRPLEPVRPASHSQMRPTTPTNSSTIEPWPGLRSQGHSVAPATTTDSAPSQLPRYEPIEKQLPAVQTPPAPIELPTINPKSN